jgi:hypothetical protein
MNVMSSVSPCRTAWKASVPELKVAYSISASTSARASSNKPCSTPMSAVECVMLGK